MSKPLDEDIAVRVIRLRLPDRWWNGEEGVERPPLVGDIGVIVHISWPKNSGLFPHMFRRKKSSAHYVVECANENGKLIYVADFAADEIEPL